MRRRREGSREGNRKGKERKRKEAKKKEACLQWLSLSHGIWIRQILMLGLLVSRCVKHSFHLSNLQCVLATYNWKSLNKFP